jgi:hypothetical protein
LKALVRERGTMDELTALATQQLERVKVACSQLGLKYVELQPTVMGVGIAIGFGQVDYTILSVMGGGNEGQLITTSGILKDIAQDRLAALEIVNRFNQRNSAYTVFLHDAEVGWSLLVQRTTPVEVFLDSPTFLSALVRGLPVATAEYREELAQVTSLGGAPWVWTAEDHSNLLLRSVL